MPNLDELLRFLSLLSWILFGIYVLAVFVRSLLTEGFKKAARRLGSAQVGIPLGVSLLVTFLSAALVFVPPTGVGVVISLISPGGVRPDPLRAGLHLIVPILEREIDYPIIWQNYTMSAKPSEGQVSGDDSIRARTSDGQEVLIDSSIIFRINPDQVVTLHIDWQDRYTTDYVRPVIRGLVRTQASQFSAREVSSSARRNLEASLERLLRESLGEKGLLVDRFLLRDITFTDDYAKAVENKQIAFEGETRTLYEANQVRNLAAGERDRLATEAQGQSDKYRIEAEGRAAAILLEAEAQAQALNLIGRALEQNPDLLTYEYIDKLSPNIRVMLVPNTAPYLLPLDGLTESLNSDPALNGLDAQMTFTTTVLPSVSIQVSQTLTSTTSP
jgi:regulator of protease activity HflC (stomatin/prohibitin superfamily)